MAVLTGKTGQEASRTFIFFLLTWELFCLQLFCNSSRSVLYDDVHCICGAWCVFVSDRYVLCGDVLLSLQLCAEIPGCCSFTSMQICLHV